MATLKRRQAARGASWTVLLLAQAACVRPTRAAGPAAPPPVRPLERGKPRFDRSQGRAGRARPHEPVAKVQWHCPHDMALIRRVQGHYCIDRWEASIEVEDTAGRWNPWPPNHPVDGREARIRAVSVPGRKPQGYISGAQAAMACAHAGKRLCETDEWVLACRGPKLTTYPYGNRRRPHVCNDRFKKLDFHPVKRLFEKYAPPGTPAVEMWSPRWMNDPRLFNMSHSVAPTGSFKECTNGYGVYDMVGNLHEWVADPAGTFFGGFFMDTYQNGEGCEYHTTFHPFDYHDYSTGFRCCADASRDP